MAEMKTPAPVAEPSVAEPSADMVSTVTPEDKYEEYNYDQDKYEAGGSGKGRSKKEAAQHTNHHDPGGHTRKTTQKLINSHEKEKEQCRKEHQHEEKSSK
jgi:nuclear protein 1